MEKQESQQKRPKKCVATGSKARWTKANAHHSPIQVSDVSIYLPGVMSTVSLAKHEVQDSWGEDPLQWALHVRLRKVEMREKGTEWPKLLTPPAAELSRIYGAPIQDSCAPSP